jgi:hypothetical protein
MAVGITTVGIMAVGIMTRPQFHWLPISGCIHIPTAQKVCVLTHGRGLLLIIGGAAGSFLFLIVGGAKGSFLNNRRTAGSFLAVGETGGAPGHSTVGKRQKGARSFNYFVGKISTAHLIEVLPLAIYGIV